MLRYIKPYLLRLEFALIFIPILLLILWPQLLSNFFNSSYMPHGHCYMWMPELVSLHVFSDFSIGAAYIAISVTLAILVFKARHDIPFHKMFLAFGVFIITCGLTHIMAIWTLWEAVYWISGSVKLITAVASVATAVALPFLVPQVLSLIKSAKISDERQIKLEEANSELASLNEKLKELDKVKTNFFSSISHELRTPLALILGPAEKLKKSGEISEINKKDINVIERNSQILLKYVNDLLDISKLEAGKLNLTYTETDISKLFNFTADNFSSLARENNIEFKIEAEKLLTAQIDAEKINRIFLNILSNAFKFTPKNGRVYCRLKKENNNIVFYVEDSGKGIKHEYRDKIFERFQIVEESYIQRFGGTGLGLSISKEFVELHNGNISVSDSSLGGALFRVEIPVKAPPNAEIKKESAIIFNNEIVKQTIAELRPGIIETEEDKKLPDTKIKITGKTETDAMVLVVEDNIDMNNFITQTLTRNFKVTSAYNGKEGLDKAVKIKPDLILTDIMMPEMNGDQMVKEIRKINDLNSTPVMLLTAKADDELRLKLLREGAQDYLMKPFSTEELIARTKNLVQTKRAVDVLQNELNSREQNIIVLAEEAALRKRDVENSLGEKIILLKEIHHRVKNNLQIISSLLSLQTENATDEKIVETLTDLKMRILSMALVHEKLYQFDNLAMIGFSEFITDLSNQLLRTYRDPSKNITLKTDIENIDLSLDKAVSIGLILNELITNSIKHAFYNKPDGEVFISVKKLRENKLVIKISDNGVGLSEKPELDKAESLGMRLVGNLMNQLDADYEIKNKEGTEYIIKIDV